MPCKRSLFNINWQNDVYRENIKYANACAIKQVTETKQDD